MFLSGRIGITTEYSSRCPDASQMMLPDAHRCSQSWVFFGKRFLHDWASEQRSRRATAWKRLVRTSRIFFVFMRILYIYRIRLFFCETSNPFPVNKSTPFSVRKSLLITSMLSLLITSMHSLLITSMLSLGQAPEAHGEARARGRSKVLAPGVKLVQRASL